MDINELRDALAQWCNDHGHHASNGAFGHSWDDPAITEDEREVAYMDADEVLALVRQYATADEE